MADHRATGRATGQYTERIAAMFGTPEQFAAQFSATTVVTPTKVHI